MRRAFVLIGLAFVICVPIAKAGTYEVTACKDNPADANASWSGFSTDPTHLETGSSCATAGTYGGLFARDNLGCEADCSLPPADTSAGWRFRAAPGTSIGRVAYSRWLYVADDEDWMPALTTDDGTVLETCRIVYPASSCEVGAAGGRAVTYDVPEASTLTFGVLCQANPYGQCTQGATIHQVSAVLYGATVTLTDNVQPSLDVTGGDLFDGGYVAGARDVSFDASDNVGIRSARAYVDGVAQPAVTYSCDFTYTVPCSDRPNAVLELDTSALDDGVHQVQVGVTDAAGNETRSAARTVTVDNDAPSAPAGLSIASQAGDTFDVTWTNPPGQVAPVVAARWQLCDSAGIRCTSGEQRGAGVDRLTAIRVPGTGEWQLSVALEDEAGNYSQQNAAGIALRYAATAVATGGEPAAV